MLHGKNILNLKAEKNVHDKDTEQLVQVVMLVTCVRKVPGSDLNYDTFPVEIFHGFPLSLKQNAGTTS